MGTLVAMRKPTLGRRADHTYVKCSTGGARWGCFGSNNGGGLLKRDQGSTKRASKIAGGNGKANLKCYLVNGVCHQAANRILLPAQRVVSGARGYRVSRALYGTYGKNGWKRWGVRVFWSPFRRHKGTTGDLSECLEAVPEEPEDPDTGKSNTEETALDQQDLEREVMAYESAAWEWSEDLSVALYDNMVMRYLPGIDRERRDVLLRVRRDIERELIETANQLDNEQLQFEHVVEVVDGLTIDFQKESAAVLENGQYASLFDLSPDDTVLLSDPSVIDSLMNDGDWSTLP